MSSSHSTSTVLVVAVAAAVLAGAAGFWGGSQLASPPAPAETRSDAAAAPLPAPSPEPTAMPREAHPRAERLPATPPPPSAPSPAVPGLAPPVVVAAPPEALAQANDALRARVAELEQKLKVSQELRKFEEGDAIAAPSGLDPRFEQETLRKNFERSLKEAGFDGAQVTSADCTEFPCILYGEGMGSREDFQKLDGTAGNQPYSDDDHSTYGWSTDGKDGQHHQRFAVALYPSDLPKETQDALRKRMQWRIHQMQETWP